MTIEHTAAPTGDASISEVGPRTAGPAGDLIPERFRSPFPVSAQELREGRPVVLDRPAEHDLKDLPSDIRKRLEIALDHVEDGTAALEPKQRELTGVFSVRLSRAWRALFYMGRERFWHMFAIVDHNYDEVERRWVASKSRMATVAYQMSHRPDPNGPPLHDMLQGGIMPDDVYEHPEYYGPPGRASAELGRIIRKHRGNPEALVTIYRAQPAIGGDTIRKGDWIALRREYAETHALHPNDPTKDMPVLSAQVKAKDVLFALDYLEEWGYYGPDVRAQKTATKTAAAPEPIARGLLRGMAIPGLEAKASEGTLTVQDVLGALRDGAAGSWWDDHGQYAWSDATEYALMHEGVPVILWAEPVAESDRMSMTEMGYRPVVPGTELRLVKIFYSPGRGWKSLDARGIRVTAGQKTANVSRDYIDMVEKLHDMMGMDKGTDTYRSVDAMIRQRGKAWNRVAEEMPRDIKMGNLGDCYQNAFNVAMNSRGKYIYVEGYASSGIMPLKHAWVVDGNGTVYDPTWHGRVDKPEGYFGIPLDLRWLMKFINDSGYYGAFAQEFPSKGLVEVLRHGLPDQALHTTGSKTASTDTGDDLGDIIVRGLSWHIEDFDLAKKAAEGRITAREIISGVEPLGVWWGLPEQYSGGRGDLSEFEYHAEGSGDPDLSPAGAIRSAQESHAYWMSDKPFKENWPEDYVKARRAESVEDEFAGCELPVVIIAERPKVKTPDGDQYWNPETHNPSNGFMGNSFLPKGFRLRIKEVRIDPEGNGRWRSLSGSGITSTAKVAMPVGPTPPLRFEVYQNQRKTTRQSPGVTWLYVYSGDQGVGLMGWMNRARDGMSKGEIYSIDVKPEFQRRGIATAMLAKAREIEPLVHHSDSLTEDGAAWSQKVAMPVGPPPPGVRYLFTSNSRGNRKPTGTYCMLGAFLGDRCIGYLTWGLQGRKIQDVWVDPEFRRRRIAETMLNQGREVDPSLTHHPDRSDVGDAWARAVSGGNADERENNTVEEKSRDARGVTNRLLNPRSESDVIDVSPGESIEKVAAKGEVYRGVPLTLDSTDPRTIRLLRALAQGASSVARDRLVGLLGGGTGRNAWTREPNAPHDSAGRWWASNPFEAFSYARGGETDHNTDQFTFPVVMTGRITEEDLESGRIGEGGRGTYYQVESGVPVEVTGIKATLPSRGQAQEMIDLFEKQGGWQVTRQTDTALFADWVELEQDELEEQDYAWPLRMSTTALPSWRDRGRHPKAEAIIAPDTGRARNNSFMVYLYGEPHARRPSLAEAKETVEEIYGSLDWMKVKGDKMPHDDPTWGSTTMFNDAENYYIVERLPRLGATAGLEQVTAQRTGIKILDVKQVTSYSRVYEGRVAPGQPYVWRSMGNRNELVGPAISGWSDWNAAQGGFTVREMEGDTQFASRRQQALEWNHPLRKQTPGYWLLVSADISGLPVRFISTDENFVIDEDGSGVMTPDTALGIGVVGDIPLNRIRSIETYTPSRGNRLGPRTFRDFREFSTWINTMKRMPGGLDSLDAYDAWIEDHRRVASGGDVNRYWGKGIDVFMPQTGKSDSPWSKRPSPRMPFPSMDLRNAGVDMEIVKEQTRPSNREFGSIDPRELTATQMGLTRDGMLHYLLRDEWEKTGVPYADKNLASNQYPLIYITTSGKKLILSGHHRAAAALVKGTKLRGVIIRESKGTTSSAHTDHTDALPGHASSREHSGEDRQAGSEGHPVRGHRGAARGGLGQGRGDADRDHRVATGSGARGDGQDLHEGLTAAWTPREPLIREMRAGGDKVVLVWDEFARPALGANRRVIAYLDRVGGRRIGWLAWDSRGIISGVVVFDSFQRKGIATAMLEVARQIDPSVVHSHALTEDGEAWSQAVALKHTIVSEDPVFDGIEFDYERIWTSRGTDFYMIREGNIVSARTADGFSAGHITAVESTNEIGAVSVKPKYQRMGLATEMLRMLREDYPGLGHTTVPGQLSNAGEAWARAVGSVQAKAQPADKTNVCIMAVPSAGDQVHAIGPEDKHATLLYFGDTEGFGGGEIAKRLMLGVIQSVAARTAPFEAKVTSVEALGNDDPPAQVWHLDSPDLKRLFSALLHERAEVEEMYDIATSAGVTRYPDYRPHVTIGYGSAEVDTDEATENDWVSDDNLDEARQVEIISFDRLSLWWGDEHLEVPLSGRITS